MATKYPIVFVHGIVIKPLRKRNPINVLIKALEENGIIVHRPIIDAVASVTTNSVVLKDYIENILQETNAEKVNIIAYSKGGLDIKHMVDNYNMEDKIASLTTICTPHRGTAMATRAFKLPKFILNFANALANGIFKNIYGDKQPNGILMAHEMRLESCINEPKECPYKFYCQSYATSTRLMTNRRFTTLPMKFLLSIGFLDNDGLLAIESAKFGNYRGFVLDEALSHIQAVNVYSTRRKRKKVTEFYINLCHELEEMGY